MIKPIFEYVVKSLVDKPESVVVEEFTDTNKTKITIKVDGQDVGKVIGKEGKTIKTLRALAASLSTKEKSILIDLLK